MFRILLLGLVTSLLSSASVPRQGQTFASKAKNEGAAIAGKVPADEFDLRLRLTWTEPGSIVDTVGLNPAKVGSYALNVIPNEHLEFRVWDGTAWITVDSGVKVAKGEETTVRVVRRAGEIHLETGGILGPSKRVTVALARDKAYVGDFPGDQNWAPKFNPNLGFVGDVTVAYVGKPSPLPTSVVHDPAGRLSRDDTTRFKTALTGLAAAGIPLAITVLAGDDMESKADVVWIWGDLRASGLLPPDSGLLAFGKSSGWVYRRASSMNSKLALSRIQEEWKKLEAQPSQTGRIGTLLEGFLATATGTPAAAPSGKAERPVELARATIGAGGGTVDAAGKLSIRFPRGALARNEQVTILTGPAAPEVHLYKVTRTGTGILPRPVQLRFVLPPGVQGPEAICVQQVTSSLWTVTPSTWDEATRTLTTEVSHFSPAPGVGSGSGPFDGLWAYRVPHQVVADAAIGQSQLVNSAIGWIENQGTRNQVRAAGAGIGGATGLVVMTLKAGGAMTFAAMTAPEWGFALICVTVGWFAVDPLYDQWLKSGMTGPFPTEHFRLFWSEDSLAGRPRPWVTIEASTGRPLCFLGPDDYPEQVKTQGRGADGSGPIQFAGLPGTYCYGDLKLQRVPEDLFGIAGELENAYAWYEKKGLNPPPGPMTVIVKDMSNWGEYDGKYLHLSTRGLAPKERDQLTATIAHEFWHATSAYNRYSENRFVGVEESVATAVESLVFPSNTAFFKEQFWSQVYPRLRNGLVNSGPREENTTPARRGYKLWPWPMFLHYRYGPEALRQWAGGTMPDDAIATRFRAFCYSLLATDQALLDLIQVMLLNNRRAVARTFWKDAGLEQLAKDTMGGSGTFELGWSDFAPSCPLSFRIMKLTVPRPPQGALVVRRARPDPTEEFVALRPKAADAGQSILSVSYTSQELVGMTGGGVVVRGEWVDSPARAPLMGVAVICTATAPSPAAGAANPVLVYRLNPPSGVKLEPLPVRRAPATTRIKWTLPGVGSTAKLGDCLWGYRVFGKTKDGKEKLIAELILDVPQASLQQVPGKATLGITAAQTQVELPAATLSPYVSLGMQSVDKALRPLVLSAIAWTDTTCHLTIDPPSFQATVAKPLGFAAKADFPPPGAKYTWKTSGKLLKGIGDKASVQFDKNGPATVTVELHDAAGKQIATATATGQAKPKETPQPTATKQPTVTGLLARLQTMKAVAVEIGANTSDGGWTEIFPQGLQGMASEAKPVISMVWTGAHFTYRYEQHWKKQMTTARVVGTRLVEGPATSTTDYSLTITGDVSPDLKSIKTLTISKRYNSASGGGSNDFRNCDVSLRDMPLTNDDEASGTLDYAGRPASMKKSIVSASASAGGIIVGVDSKYVTRNNTREIDYFKTTQQLVGTSGSIAPEKFTKVTIRFSDNRFIKAQ